nr:MAG TPA: hypothetical protein [Caudoviricetes sp.]
MAAKRRRPHRGTRHGPGGNARHALDLAWNNLSGYSAAGLANLVRAPGSAWDKAWQAHSMYIRDEDMADDATFLRRPSH